MRDCPADLPKEGTCGGVLWQGSSPAQGAALAPTSSMADMEISARIAAVAGRFGGHEGGEMEDVVLVCVKREPADEGNLSRG